MPSSGTQDSASRRTSLVASVTGATVEALLRAAGEGSEGADVIEWRVDGLENLGLAGLKRLRTATEKPAILTCRCRSQGGAFGGSERERLSLLREAAALAFEYIDLELDACERAMASASFKRDGGSRLILSHHDFNGLPKDAASILERARELGADVVKLAARVCSLSEALELIDLSSSAVGSMDFVPVPMGATASSARLLAARFGAPLVYAAAGGCAPAGPGQIGLAEMRERFRIHEVSEETAIYGIVGTRALDSLSPAMHNRQFRELGVDALYLPFQEQNLESFVNAARRLGVAGLSVTMPYKQSILEYLDDLDPEAARVGAVNTVVVRDGRWTGFNTDIAGVRLPLERAGSWKGKKAIVVGAGGAARAAGFALAQLGARLRIASRSPEKARALASELGAQATELSALSPPDFDLLVNATPLGSEAAAPAPFDWPAIPPQSLVFDMVVLPLRTSLLRKAEARKARTISGLEMLVAQAAEQTRLWTGQEGSWELLRRAATEAAGEREPSPPRGEASRISTRYSRQILFKEIGDQGQRRIRESKVVVAGVGALGSVSSEMLARAGVGTLRLIDRDYLDETNLQRQTLYDELDLEASLPKAVAAAGKLSRINRDVRVESFVEDIHAGNVMGLVEGCDLVLDGTDNFETRYLLNDACLKAGLPWIYAACVASYGMSFAIVPGKTPCLRCFLRQEPAPGTSPTCDTAGVIGPVVHAVASFQVAEALKILAGRPSELLGTVVSIDVWRGRFDRFRATGPDEDCPACRRNEWSYLSGTATSQAISLCGRNAVQVRPVGRESLPLTRIAERLSELGKVTVNEHLLRFQLPDREIVLFRDGRAIIHGTEDPGEAKSLYARYLGA